MKKVIGPAACLIAGFGGVALLALTPPAQTLTGSETPAGYVACDFTGETVALGCATELPPCEWEDSVGPCFWNAEARGNGIGRSFVSTADGTIVPVK